MSEPTIRPNFLSYVHRLQRRSLEEIDLVVIHCTELPELRLAREYGERIHYPESATGNSGHFYVERSGCIEQWVPVDRVAHHTRGYNTRSIGVELVNSGRYPNWFDSEQQQLTEPYPNDQVNSLIRLVQSLQETLPALRWIAGHDALDRGRVAASDDPRRTVRRKVDPGPLFPWTRVLGGIRLQSLERVPASA